MRKETPTFPCFPAPPSSACCPPPFCNFFEGNWKVGFYTVRVLGRVVFSLCGCQNPSPTLGENLASMGPGMLSSIGVGVWKKVPEAFSDSRHYTGYILAGFSKGIPHFPSDLPVNHLRLKALRGELKNILAASPDKDKNYWQVGMP